MPPVAPLATPDGGALHRGVSFSLPDGYRPLLLDLHVPAREGGPVPVVVWIHGGGFYSGDRRCLPDTMDQGSVFEALVAVATVDYRLSGEARFPAQLDDVLAALAYLRAFAGGLGLDPERIGVWGESAGGTPAALAALTDGRVAAAALWYPLADLALLDRERADTPWARLIGGAPSALPEAAAQASPVSHVPAAAPPVLLLHGTADESLPALHSERLHALLLAAGARSAYLPVEGAGHCFAGCEDIPALITTTVDFLAREPAAR
ncbi:alpha/beta hydrolase fold domain-containing protein [Kitasatospora sp. NPDC057223]|uniref:alpha/beta hydrolase fold domain-containing protein n=1 Tax=Kitasatospora sp. NPDC057223 TaxID=3346055 RepID=UPI003641416E